MEPRFGRGIWARGNRAGHSSKNLGARFGRGFGRVFGRGFGREIRALFWTTEFHILKQFGRWFLGADLGACLGTELGRKICAAALKGTLY